MRLFWIRLTTMILAMALDWVFGEPPERLHPTVWMGKYILKAEKQALERNGKKTRRVLGAVIAISTILLFTVPTYFLEMILVTLTGNTIYIIFASVALKTTFAARCMHQYNKNLCSAIQKGRLEDARQQMTLLVRRDPWRLDQKQMISASVETIAEGIVDGVISPLFYFSLLGLPGAVAYRAVNTLDSMIGYKDPTYIDLGFFSAKLDTAANYIPARITSLFLVVSALILGEDAMKSLQILRRDHSKTESLNAGWSMSAMAGALGLELEKKGYYKLGDSDEELSINHVSRALRMHITSILLFLIFTALPLIYLTSKLTGGF
ncbi:MAG: cobalamin biosynthesis protein [Candidatus Bathyarchaeota archaeon]|nr:MAG: cobalamin biosynthesis protein [Candidatus Bathyarchaeota archaeon]